MSIDKIEGGAAAGAGASHQILRSMSVLSVGTVLSRILGFVRDILFAHFFGTAAGADAFVVAFRIPNLFRDVIGEGAANSSFVPVLAQYKEGPASELKAFLNAAITWAGILLLAVTVSGVLFSPQIMGVIAPGFASDPAQKALATDLTRIMFPYLVLIGMTAFFSAIQFTYGSFRAPALGPCLLNVALIVSTLAAVWWMERPVYGLALGVLAGGVLQFVYQARALRGQGIRFSFPSRFYHPGVVQMGRLLLPRIAGTAVYQLNVFVDTICASLSGIVGAGAVSAVYYANRIVFLPMGVFAVALVSAVLPVLSAHAVAGRREEFRKTVAFSLQNIIFVMMPMTVFLVLLSEPVIRVVFERGIFDGYSTAVTSIALFFYSMGLCAFAGIKVLANAFHALQDTRTPVKVAAVCVGLNLILNLVLMYPMKIAGVALASSLAAFVNAGTLLILLSRRVGNWDGLFDGFFLRIALAVLVQGGVVAGVWMVSGALSEILRLGCAILLGAVVYWTVAVRTGLPQPRMILEAVLKKV
ncbi:MAG: murein biosynthesis integral membrane protein MurJ [Elusimicrobia bacterium]|nr:murein biosynthesis integral membrane protein MurJ [Elusimicrobiota bacterium]